MAETPTYAITDLFTEDEIKRALELYETSKPGSFNKAVTDQIVRKVIDRINATTGQENDPSYLGYMIEYVFSQAGPTGPGL